MWPLDREGFISHYMVSGPVVEPFRSDKRDRNQLRYEAGLRAEICAHEPVPSAGHVKAGMSRLGMPWVFQGGRDTAFVNLSDFYTTMQRVRFDAATALLCPRAMEVEAGLWSYAAVDLYLNGTRIQGIDRAVYKPVTRQNLRLSLREGLNVLYLACETLGVRDTRSVVGLQILEGREEIRVTLPDQEMAQAVAPALRVLEEAAMEGNALLLPQAPEGSTWAVVDTEDPDHAHAGRKPVWQALPVIIPEEAECVRVRIPWPGGFLERTYECTEHIRPRLVRPVPSPEENLQLILGRIARVESLNRDGGAFGFPIANILARRALHDTSMDDHRLLMEMLDLIEKRVDCSDFLVCGLLRYLRHVPVDGETEERIREVLTHFRYWMDQDGFDGMCFWSENHALMFYASAMEAGRLWPEADFPLAGMKGRELYAWGREKVTEWLEDVEEFGFEEFLSTVYTCVTFAALIHVVDFCEPEMSERARRLTDRMLEMLAMHTFRGGIIAPQGRVYRGVLYPFRAGAMALMNLADPARPYDYGEGWLGFYATSTYRFPKGLKERMDTPASLSYTTGNARIVLEKHEDWCLTSVQIPGERKRRWENISRRPDADVSSHAFVKSYNECFHGTTFFQPGVWGYQQHLWYAALDGEAVVFMNHPGSSSEGGDMRPGYWHGSGVFPALRQEGNILGLIWRIPETHPLHFLHLYCPRCRFEEIREAGEWLLLRKGRGFAGIWTSRPRESWDGMNFGCEERIWGSECACLCVCGGAETEDMDRFEERVISLAPRYVPETGTLTAGTFRLVYEAGEDDTQYL